MQYVHLDAQLGGMSGVLDPARYLSHRSSISRDPPPGARAFATDTDHYDFRSRRCVKDLTLQSVRDAAGEEKEVAYQHNCCKHDQDLLIRYAGVSGFVTDRTDEHLGTGLGTVILDEILPHRDGCSHEIVCWEGVPTIVCHDLQATWTEAVCSRRA